ncbi:MAG: tetratricopeptide repeat protein [Lachnospiraceae bacterium]|nr:tetratricopeptide repeat protein [Lachnospiraceae bacterium]
MKRIRLQTKRIHFAFAAVLLGSALLFAACASRPEPGAHTKAAEEAITALNYTQAVEEAKTAIVTGEDARQAYRLMGIAYLRNAGYAEAAEAFQSALSRSDGIPDAMDYDMNLYLAECKKRLGAYEEAVTVYDHVLALRPSDAETLYERGEAKLKLDRLTDATADFDAAVRLQNRDMDLRIRIYLAYAEAGYEDAGKSVLQEALNSFGNAMSYYEKGKAAYYLGNNAEAQSLLEKALTSSRGEERAQTVLMLGLTGERQGDFGYAVDVYTDYLENETQDARILNRRGICRMEQGDYRLAIADFEQGKALQDAEAYRALARNEITAYEYLGDFSKARKLMEEYMQRFPDDEEAAREHAFLSTR